ncbi:DNA-directed RNA polymerase subunit beta [Chloroflexota bacterium]
MALATFYQQTRKNYARIPDVLEIPNLIELHQNSYRWFLEGGLRDLFDEVSPIKDFTDSRYELRFLDYEFSEPKYSEQECHERDRTYAVPLKVKTQLVIKETGEIKEQALFMGDFPWMTPKGTFLINGAERVVVSQLVRSPSVYFTIEEDVTTGRSLCSAKLIPNRGAWLEFETSNRDVISVKVDRKRKIPIATLLRAIGYGSDDEVLALFADVDTDPDHPYIQTTIDREPLIKDEKAALIDFYKRLRPGNPPTLENARALMTSLFFNPRRYDLGKVGRYKLNKRLGLDISNNQRILSQNDLVAIVRNIIRVNNGWDTPDVIDHLGNRRVRAVGELLQNQIRVGLLRMERVVKERMSLLPLESATPSALVNTRPVVAAVREFFGSSQLSQFMDQTNPLAELTHKRRLSALGPGGLSRERAGFDVRDVHHSHYGRICPIETPEGPNIGLISSMATYARVNEYGFLETPYRKVIKELSNISPEIAGRTLSEAVFNAKGKIVADVGAVVTSALAAKLAKLPSGNIKCIPFASYEVRYLSADEEEVYIIAQANTRLDGDGHFIDSKVEVRYGEKILMETPDKVDFMDVSPKQLVSVTASLIPFLEHDDANRALMGSNMQRQAVPLISPEAPLVATGMEREAARDSGQVIFSTFDGVVTEVAANRVEVTEDGGGEQVFSLTKFARSNQGTSINQRPVVSKGDRVVKGQVLADGSATDGGELAVGQNVLCAFLSWEGYNFEDAIVISESLLREDRYTSVHIEKYEVEARDTKLGAEEITRDIPNVGEESLRNLDDSGIICVGSEVNSGDILVGKITPKGERGLTAEEKLLRAIFGEKAREVKDTSLRVPHGESGTVIDVKVFSRSMADLNHIQTVSVEEERHENYFELPAGVNQMVRVFVAQKRKICAGDKMAGRHGNKGVVARILPLEDMPYLPDGRPIEMVLSPLGVPSRMNIGQLLETHLGWAAHTLGLKVMSPVFDGADDASIEDALALAWIAQKAGAAKMDHENNSFDENEVKAWLAERGYDGEKIFADGGNGEAKQICLQLWLEDTGVDVSGWSGEDMDREIERLYHEKGLVPPISGKTMLYDGRTGEPFDNPVTVGYLYMMKLIHLVEDKVHARSTGPYSLITQQPLGGKAQFGGQRFGEMEVWALEAYGAAHNLQEMLTVKSDDIVGRVKTYEAIVNGEDVLEPGIPESFKVLVYELRSLGLSIEVLNEDEERVTYLMESAGEVPKLGINLTGFEE